MAASSAAPAKAAAPKTPVKPAPPKGKYASKAGIGWASPAYVAMVKQWHLPSSSKPPVDAGGRPKLVLYSINRGEHVELTASTDHGGFAPTEIDKATWILRGGDGYEHAVDASLLDVVYDLQRHFKAAEIRFVSGYRAPLKRLGSNHGYGRAIDLVVPGTIDEWVASYVRELGFSGAGTYPISGFVHVDVRERSFYWIDKSGPGAPNKTKGVLPGDAVAHDVQARKSGKVAPPSPTIGRDVDAAIGARVKAVLGAAAIAPGGEPNEGADVDADDEAAPNGS
ncbi:MAG: hypothetical protein NVS3B10_19680 [Polyangiales bacterium]